MNDGSGRPKSPNSSIEELTIREVADLAIQGGATSYAAALLNEAASKEEVTARYRVTPEQVSELFILLHQEREDLTDAFWGGGSVLVGSKGWEAFFDRFPVLYLSMVQGCDRIFVGAHNYQQDGHVRACTLIQQSHVMNLKLILMLKLNDGRPASVWRAR
jgi:hypothetical protein